MRQAIGAEARTPLNKAGCALNNNYVYAVGTAFTPHEEASQLRGDPLAYVVLGVAMALGIGCAVKRQAPHDITAAKLRQMHGALLEFRAAEGRLPDSLESVCLQDARLCELASPRIWILDGWGRRLAFVRRNGHFELHSAGADGLASTDDDMSISSLLERRQVERFAGCYRMPLPWWTELRGDVVILDSVPLGSGYTLLPDAGPYIGRWVPTGRDSVRLSWIRGDQGVTIVLRGTRDSLVGRAGGNGHSVVGVKTPCP